MDNPLQDKTSDPMMGEFEAVFGGSNTVPP
jgi:hypothetical protein